METREISGRFDPRPVADAPTIALYSRSDQLTKQWVAEIVLASELQRSAQLPLEEMARSGPLFIGGLLNRVTSPVSDNYDHSWLSLFPDAALALDCLRSILFANLLAEWQRPSPTQVAELAERLSWLTATALSSVGASTTPTIKDLRIETQLEQLVERGDPFTLIGIELGDYQLLSPEDRQAADSWLLDVSWKNADESLSLRENRLWLASRGDLKRFVPPPHAHGVPLKAFCGKAEFPKQETAEELIETVETELLAAQAAGLELRPAGATGDVL